MDRQPITIEGHHALKIELEQLIRHDRPSISNAIADARAMGDLKENAEYHAARERQSFVEGRIKELESAISNSQVIDIAKIPDNGKVVFGTTITLENSDTKKLVTYKIVGEIEADINKNLIAITSPIARALISKKKGATITFAENSYLIKNIERTTG